MSERRVLLLLSSFDRWGFDTKGWSPKTREQYVRVVKRTEEWLRRHKNKSLLYCTTDDLKAFLFAQSKSPIYRNGLRQALVAFGQYCVDSNFWNANRAISLPRLPQRRSLPKALTTNQARELENAAHLKGGMVWAAVSVFLYTGMRCDEVRTLEWRFLDLDEGWVRFTAKGNKNREMPLARVPRRALLAWQDDCLSARWVFPSPRFDYLRPRWDQPVSANWFVRTLKDLGDDAGLKGLHPHLLRHTCATRLLNQGVDIREVQEFLGHASLATTQVYTTVFPKRLKELADRLTYQE